MDVVPCFNVKVVALIVAGSITSLKVALTVLLTTTFVAVSTGSVEVTDGIPGVGLLPLGLGLPNSTSC
jgi:hypothetical protein